MKKKIYLAGGWFTPKQEEEHTRMYNLLKDKFDVFNPRLKGEVFSTTSQDDMTKILLGNCEGICTSNIVVAIYDGKDTGTIWETGFAYAHKIPIIYYAEKLNGKPFNLMLAKTGNFAANEDELLRLLSSEESYISKSSYDYKGEVE